MTTEFAFTRFDDVIWSVTRGCCCDTADFGAEKRQSAAITLITSGCLHAFSRNLDKQPPTESLLTRRSSRLSNADNFYAKPITLADAKPLSRRLLEVVFGARAPLATQRISSPRDCGQTTNRSNHSQPCWNQYFQCFSEYSAPVFTVDPIRHRMFAEAEISFCRV